MPTRQDLILEFTKALCANPAVMEELDNPDQLIRAAEMITDSYLKRVG